MKIVSRMIMFAIAATLAACADGSGPSLVKTMCLMRENVCKEQCDAMRAEQALACRQSCESGCQQ